MEKLISNGWELSVSSCGNYAYAKRSDRPGQIDIKAEDEGYVVDIWDEDWQQVVAECHSLYCDLETSDEC